LKGLPFEKICRLKFKNNTEEAWLKKKKNL